MDKLLRFNLCECRREEGGGRGEEGGGRREDKKRVDLNDKVTLELTARLIIASCGLRRACMGRRWVDGKP